MYVKDGSWKRPRVYVKDSGSWKEAKKVFVRSNGSWKEVYKSETTHFDLWPENMNTSVLNPYITHNNVEVYNSNGSEIYFSGGNGYHLEFEFPVYENHSRTVIDMHYYGYSMEHSGFYWFIEDNHGGIHKLECRGSSSSHSDGIFPKNCDNLNYNTSGINETINTTYSKTVPSGIKRIVFVFSMHDNSYGDRAYIRGLTVKTLS